MKAEMEELPHRCIFNDVDMKAFMESSTKKELLSFVEAMGKSCTTGNARFDPASPLDDLTPSMASLHGSLSQMIGWIDDFPPTNPEAARFGNPAFRLWHGRLMERSNSIITSILQARDENLTVEQAAERGRLAAAGELETKEDASIRQVSCYLHDSFGHATRLDYGTGHESSFLVFLLVLSKVKCLGESPTLPSLRATALSIFSQYLQVTRKLVS
jgi:serine/threonine-protein phosphatase 2A activator